MQIKTLVLFFLLLSFVYATAPSWVDRNVNINYTFGSNTVSYKVIERTGNNIKLEISTIDSSGAITSLYRPTDNASASISKENFWVDNSLLANTFVGTQIDVFSVTEMGTMPIAGKDWETVTMEGSSGGGPLTTKIVDKQTGLLLKQTVATTGVPPVTLKNSYIPAFASSQPEQSPQTPSQPSSPNSNPPTSNQNLPPSQPPSGTTQSSGQQPSANDSGNADTSVLKPPEKQNIPCCPIAFVLLIFGYLAVKYEKK